MAIIKNKKKIRVFLDKVRLVASFGMVATLICQALIMFGVNIAYSIEAIIVGMTMLYGIYYVDWKNPNSPFSTLEEVGENA